jgi:hypothetical protein
VSSQQSQVQSQRTGTVRATSNPCWSEAQEENCVNVGVDSLRANGSLHVSIWSEQHGMGLVDQEVGDSHIDLLAENSNNSQSSLGREAGRSVLRDEILTRLLCVCVCFFFFLLKVGRLEIPLGAAMDCCHGQRGRAYCRWFPLLLPQDAATVVGDEQGLPRDQCRSEEVDDSHFKDFVPCLQLELVWRPELIPVEAKMAKWALISVQAVGLSLVDSERALDLLQVSGDIKKLKSVLLLLFDDMFITCTYYTHFINNCPHSNICPSFETSR